MPASGIAEEVSPICLISLSNGAEQTARATISSAFLFLLRRSTHGGPDWTCILVGFSSGYVRMYTEVLADSSLRKSFLLAQLVSLTSLASA